MVVATRTFYRLLMSHPPITPNGVIRETYRSLRSMTDRTFVASLTSAYTANLTTVSTAVLARFDDLRERNRHRRFSILEEGDVGEVDLPGLGRDAMLRTENCHII